MSHPATRACNRVGLVPVLGLATGLSGMIGGGGNLRVSAAVSLVSCFEEIALCCLESVW